jgi:CrcB protein
MSQLLLVFVGGGLGAAARWGFGLAVARLAGSGWPWGTLGVNVLGGLAMGLVIGLAARLGWPEGARLFLATGVLGGFTTFSAFSLETMAMIEAGRWSEAALYAGVSVVVSVAALGLGLLLARHGLG